MNQAHCNSAHTHNPPSPFPSHTHPASLLHDITLRCPSQPHLVGSDERVSQLVLRSHVIRGDIAASAARRARALGLLIRRLKGVWRGCLFLCVSPFAPARAVTNPRNTAVGQSVFPIATRQLTPGAVDADCVAVTKPSPSGREQRWRVGRTKKPVTDDHSESCRCALGCPPWSPMVWVKTVLSHCGCHQSSP